MKHTKILATYGPAVESQKLLERLINEGVDAFRVNCSHGTTADYVRAAERIRAAEKVSDFPIGLLFDISGPKLRLDQFDGELDVEIGQELKLVTSGSDLPHGIIGVNHPAILSSIRVGERLLIDDGNVNFEIKSVSGSAVVAVATNAGTLLPAKGINLPDTDIQIPTIGEKDRQDIRTAVETGADFIALSFVRSVDDIREARRLIEEAGGDQRIIAKLEKKESIRDLDAIMAEGDGVMIARGDLGVELPPTELPRLQKRIIRLARESHCPVIVATQMLESMRFAPRATRAEISDVAGAVFDHADTLMLSAETATGAYPVEAVRVMADTIREVENGLERRLTRLHDKPSPEPVPFAIAHAVSSAEYSCRTVATFALTSSGFTGGLMSGSLASQPVIALSSDRRLLGSLTLYRSVHPVCSDTPETFEQMIEIVNDVASRYRLAKADDRVIVTGGMPFGSGSPTNFMMIHTIGR